MALCANCGEEVPTGSRFCLHCGARQERKPSPLEQPSLPFSPWGPPPALQPAGAGGAAVPAEPVVGPALSTRQVGIAVVAILAFLFLLIFIGRSYHTGTSAQTPPLPTLGQIGQAVTIGDTVLGVAFIDTPQRVKGHTSKRGHLLAVGVVVGNRGDEEFTLSGSSLALCNQEGNDRFQPVVTGWGRPEQLESGDYKPNYTLASRQTVAGLLVFDVPNSITQPRLLVRDLNGDPDFTGMIDLTHTAKSRQHRLRFASLCAD